MTRKKDLTIKQKKFVKAYVATDGNGLQSAKAAYDVHSDTVAASIASENLNKPNVKSAIDKALAKHEITIDAAVKPIAEGLEAERPSFIDKDGNERGGGVDHTTRLKASGMALKLLGADQGQGRTIIFNNGDMVRNKYVKD